MVPSLQPVLSIKVEIVATIEHRGHEAVYSIQPERPGIYLAKLVTYHGNHQAAPPSIITMIRGPRKWSGSIRMESLLMQLGQRIDAGMNTTNGTLRKILSGDNP